MEKIRVLVWNEYKHEQESEKIAAVYPEGIRDNASHKLEFKLGFKGGKAI